MKINEQAKQQIERAVKKIAQKFPSDDNPTIITDIHLLVSQDSGEILAFDDNDNEITRCIVEQWIDNTDDNFYEEITGILRNELQALSGTINTMGILKPFSFVLEDDEKEHIAELYVSDDDTIIVDSDLMENLDSDLDSFLDNLLKE
jgi:hypothetical protein